MRRKVVVAAGLALVFTIILISIALAVSINWGAAANPIYNETGVGNTLLADGDIVQLVWDKDGDGIDPPDFTGSPSGGDELLDSSTIGTGTFPSTGKFSDNTNTTTVGSGDQVYIRAWNDSSLTSATHYGDSPIFAIDSDVAFTLDATASGSFATTKALNPGCIPEDVNCDGVVDVDDIIEVVALWRSRLGDPDYDPDSDVNKDNVINVVDAMMIAAAMGP